MGAKERAEQLALEVLDQHWPDQSVPVNPVVIAQKLGLEVKTAKLEDDVSGALIGSGGTFEIVLNESDAVNRQRFTCAHEIGHYIDRKSRGLEPTETVDFRDYMSSTGQSEDERFANAFAANLLMPSWALEKYVGIGFRADTLGRIFQVSPAAIGFRLSNAGHART
jgi:Zn-dependent peptidase ImmA (M78 family)